MSVELKLEASWLAKLAPEFQKPYMKKLGSFLRQSKRQKKIIFPKGSDIFHAFYATPVNKGSRSLARAGPIPWFWSGARPFFFR